MNGIIVPTEYSLMPVTRQRVLIDSALTAMTLCGVTDIYIVTNPHLAGNLAYRFAAKEYRDMGIYPRIVIGSIEEQFELLRANFTLYCIGNRWITPQAFADGLENLDSTDDRVHIGSKANGLLWYTYIYPKAAKSLTTDKAHTYPISYATVVTSPESYLRLLDKETQHAYLRDTNT